MEEREFEIKRELISKVKELAEKPVTPGAIKEATALRKQWRSSYEGESLYEKELEDEFNSYLDKVYTAQRMSDAEIAELKNGIIEKAKEVLNEKNFKNATAKMNALMDDWKKTGHIEKEKDDELWASFKEVREEFFQKRQNYYDELKASFAQSKAAKEELIEKAKAANENENIKELTAAMTQLMDEWKKAGNAGKENDNALWEQFLEQRQIFYKKKNAYNEQMREMYAKRTAAKKELIAKAEEYLAASEFTEEEVNAVKNLRQEWKAIGSAGKENENTLWERFNSLLNKYFEERRYNYR